MRKVKPLLLITTFLFLSCLVQAQFDMPAFKDVMALKNRQLIVLVSQPCDDLKKEMDKINDPKLMGECNKYVAYYNNLIKTAVAKFWTFNSGEVLYKTADELNEIMKDKSRRDKYVVMFCFSYTNRHDLDWRTYDEGKDGIHITTGIPYFGISVPGESPLYSIEMPRSIPAEYDLSYAVSTTNFIFNYIINHNADADMKNMISENSNLLSKKTLLILKSSVAPLMVSAVGKYYPGKYKLADYDGMSTIINSGDAGFAYIMHREYNRDNHAAMNWIVNCENGAILGYTRSGTSISGNSDEDNYDKYFFENLGDIYNSGLKK